MKLKTKLRITVELLIIVSSLLVLSIGVNLNHFVFEMNNNLMPVYKMPVYDRYHETFNDPSEVNYFWLTDIIPIGHYALSIGDIFYYLGLIVFSSSIIRGLAYLVYRYIMKEKEYG